MVPSDTRITGVEILAGALWRRPLPSMMVGFNAQPSGNDLGDSGPRRLAVSWQAPWRSGQRPPNAVAGLHGGIVTRGLKRQSATLASTLLAGIGGFRGERRSIPFRPCGPGNPECQASNPAVGTTISPPCSAPSAQRHPRLD